MSALTRGCGRNTTVYDFASQRIAAINALAERTTTIYDLAGRSLAVIDPVTNRTSTVYDAAGQAIAAINALSRRTTSIYDLAGRALAQIDPLGARTTSVYDAAGQTLAQIDPLAFRTSSVYDLAGRALAQIDALANRASMVYDAASQLIAALDPLSNRSSSVFDLVGRALAQINPLGNRSSMVYDAASQPIGAIDPLGRRSTSVFDLSGYVQAAIDALGNTTDYTIDPAGQLIETTDPLGNTTQTIFDPAGQVLGTIDPFGRRTDLGLDAQGQQTSIVQPFALLVFDNFQRAMVGPSWTTVGGNWQIANGDQLYDATAANGDLLINNTAPSVASYMVQAVVGVTGTSLMARAGLIGRYQDSTHYYFADFAPAGGVVQICRVVGTSVTQLVWTTITNAGVNPLFQFSLTGTLLRVYLNNVLVLWVYDNTFSLPGSCGVRMGTGGVAGQQTAWWTNFSATILTYKQTIFDPRGLTLAEVDALGVRTSYVYDQNDNRIATIDGLSHRTTTVYDIDERVVAQIDALGGRTTTVYDLSDRQIALINPLSQRATTLYNPTGTVLAQIDPLGRRTSLTYDAASRQIRSTDPAGHITSTVYDGDGQTIATINALGLRTSFTYDRDSQRIRLTDANAHATTFLFDPVGRDAGSIDPLLRRVTFAYDDGGNKILKLDPRGNRATFLYDQANRVIGERYTDGRVHTYTYDYVGNRPQVADQTGVYTTTYSLRNELLSALNPDQKLNQYLYDALSRRSRLIDPSAGRFSYIYDAKSRLTGLVNPQGKRTSLTYDPLDRTIQQVHGNQSRTSWSFDAASQLLAVVSASSAGLLVNRFSYTYDQAGNRTGVRESSGARTTWSYDKSYQLLHEQRTGIVGFNVTYTYDGAGNRLTQRDSGQPTTYVYDVANELLSERAATITSFTYDNCGNRTQMNSFGAITYYKWDASNRMVGAEPVAGPVSMTYNADDHRIVKQTTTQTRKFIYDYEKELQETNAAGVTQKEFTHSTGVYGDLLSEFTGGTSLYHEYDGLGSTDALVNDLGVAADRFAYRAFGLQDQYTGTDKTDYSYVGRVGYFNDAEINLYFVRKRYYDWSVGRWVSEDPKGIQAGDPNFYRYVGNNPVNATDPSGLQEQSVPTVQSLLDKAKELQFRFVNSPQNTGALQQAIRILERGKQGGAFELTPDNLVTIEAGLARLESDLANPDLPKPEVKRRPRVQYRPSVQHIETGEELNERRKLALGQTGSNVHNMPTEATDPSGLEESAYQKEYRQSLRELGESELERKLEERRQFLGALLRTKDSDSPSGVMWQIDAIKAEIVSRRGRFSRGIPEPRQAAWARNSRRYLNRVGNLIVETYTMGYVNAVVAFTPGVNALVVAYELIAGKDIFGNKLSTADKIIAAGTASLPLIGRLVGKVAPLLRGSARGAKAATELEESFRALRAAKTDAELATASQRFKNASEDAAKILTSSAAKRAPKTSPAQALEEIAKFREQQGLPAYKQSPGSTGTVARVEVEGTPYYGQNSSLPGYSLSLEARRSWFDLLKSKGKLQGLEKLGDAQFLSHAEAEALIKAYKANGNKLPKQLVLTVDRPTCPNCQKYLGDLAGELGVKEIKIYWKNQTGGPLTIIGK